MGYIVIVFHQVPNSVAAVINIIISPLLIANGLVLNANSSMIEISWPQRISNALPEKKIAESVGSTDNVKCPSAAIPISFGVVAKGAGLSA